MLFGIGAEYDPVNTLHGPDNRINEIVDVMRAAPNHPLNIVRVSQFFSRYSLTRGVYTEHTSRAVPIGDYVASRGIKILSVVGGGPAVSPGPSPVDASWTTPLGLAQADWVGYQTGQPYNVGLIPTAAWPDVLATYVDWITAINGRLVAGGRPVTDQIIQCGNEITNSSFATTDHAFLDYMVAGLKSAFPTQTVLGPASYGGWYDVSTTAGAVADNAAMVTLIDSMFDAGHGTTWRGLVDGYSLNKYLPYSRCNGPVEYASAWYAALQAEIAQHKTHTSKPLWLTEFGCSGSYIGMDTVWVNPAFRILSHQMIGACRAKMIERVWNADLAAAIFFTAVDAYGVADSLNSGLSTYTNTDNSRLLLDDYHSGTMFVFDTMGFTTYDTNPPSGAYAGAAGEVIGHH